MQIPLPMLTALVVLGLVLLIYIAWSISWQISISMELGKISRRAGSSAAFNKLFKMEEYIMAQIDDLKAAAARETAVDASVVALLQQLVTLLQAANNSQGAPNPDVQAVIDTMNANATSLAAAVAVNTPAAANPSATGGQPATIDGNPSATAPAPVATPAPAPAPTPATPDPASTPVAVASPTP